MNPKFNNHLKLRLSHTTYSLISVTFFIFHSVLTYFIPLFNNDVLFKKTELAGNGKCISAF